MEGQLRICSCWGACDTPWGGIKEISDSAELAREINPESATLGAISIGMVFKAEGMDEIT